MTIQELINQMQKKINEGEYQPSMRVIWDRWEIINFPFKYEHGNIHFSVHERLADDDEYELDNESQK